MSDLAHKKCIPCSGGVPKLTADQIAPLIDQIDAQWQVIDDHHLSRDYTFKNFAEALEFTNQVGALAEEEGHHPDIYLAWGKVNITMWTHKIDGLSESDFILAAKIDALSSNQ